MLQLRAWLDHYRVASNNYRGKKDCIPPPRPLPTLEVHRGMPLFRFHALVIQLRSLRAGWDDLVRRYEESQTIWESGKSQDHRHSLLHYGRTVLDSAYLSNETLEAKADTEQQQCMHTLAGNLRQYMMRFRFDPYHEEKREEDSEDDAASA
jgi:hypothetical protein